MIGIAVAAGALVPAPDSGALRDKLDAYLLEYQPQLSLVVAVETITRQLEGKPVYRQGVQVLEAGPRQTLESEVSFGSLPGDAGWQ